MKCFVAGIISASMIVSKGDLCTSNHGFNCVGDDIGSVTGISTHPDCCAACKNKAGCNAWTWHWPTKECFLKSACTNRQSSSTDYHSSPSPSPSPTPPTPTPPAPPSPPTPPSPTPSNPLGIVPLPNREDNFFLIIGDWGAPTDAGWAHSTGGCQRQIAQMMKDYVKRYEAQGKKCLFVAAVGDNFYAAGLKDDNHWNTQWANVYGTNDPNSGLHDIPWFAVMGNHDIGNDDPTCACGGVCKQFNSAPRPSGTHKFWMPDYYYNYYIPGVDLEVIGLDTNAVDVGGIGGDGCGNGGKITCQKCGGQSKIQSFLSSKMTDGEQFLDERARTTTAKTALIIQHYNYAHGIGNVGDMLKKRFESNNGGKTQVLSAYGHAHDQKCEGSRDRGCDVIMTGGGGGWKGGGYFGFTAVHLTNDGGFQTKLETSEVRISQHSCSYLQDDVNASRIAEIAVVV